MSWVPAGFVFFSTIEGAGLFALMTAIFRMKANDYLWPALFVILLMSLQSYVLRNVLDLAYLVPLINILLFVLMLSLIIRIPLIWSSIIAISGYLAFSLIQVLLVLLLFGSISSSQSSVINQFMGQAVCGWTCMTLAAMLYRLGIGFTFDFERLRLRWEGLSAILLIVVFLLLYSFFMYKNELSLYIVFFPVTLILFLYFSVRKEKMND